VDATIAGIENDNANGEVFNVGTGVATDVMTVAKTLIVSYGIDVPVTITGNFRLGDIRHNFADLTKIKSKLGFEPKFDFEKGIKQFTDWVLQQDIQENKLNDSLDEMKAKGLFK
jgi:dTDP-L-rhamnose 4-epimerase